MKTVNSKDGTTIAFDQLGQGSVVILVNGAMGTRSHAAPGSLADILSKQLTVIDYDRRGRGDSGDTLPYAVQREIEDIEALIEAAGGSAFLFGTSSGAILALEAARVLPGKVKTWARSSRGHPGVSTSQAARCSRRSPKPCGAGPRFSTSPWAGSVQASMSSPP